MSSLLSPVSIEELAAAVRATPRLLAVGARTKPRLSAIDADVTLLSTGRLSGMIEYDPGEFTFTALAGTPVREIVRTLAERGQYLPFDPMLVTAGATLGGTVAAGLSGPGRFRFGGIRDFILGVRFVDGMGRVLRMGGKVVKNAAGFDLPKFFVGSLGRVGVLAELTFKVFPKPASTATIRIPVASVSDAATIFGEAATSRFEPDALDLLPGGTVILYRVAGPEPAIHSLAQEIATRWQGELLSAEAAAPIWQEINEFAWAPPEATLVKVSLTATQIPALNAMLSSIGDARLHVSAGGDLGFISCTDAGALDHQLQQLRLRGITLRGAGPLWCGAHIASAIAQSVKAALDPANRFPTLEMEPR